MAAEVIDLTHSDDVIPISSGPSTRHGSAEPKSTKKKKSKPPKKKRSPLIDIQGFEDGEVQELPAVPEDVPVATTSQQRPAGLPKKVESIAFAATSTRERSNRKDDSDRSRRKDSHSQRKRKRSPSPHTSSRIKPRASRASPARLDDAGSSLFVLDVGSSDGPREVIPKPLEDIPFARASQFLKPDITYSVTTEGLMLPTHVSVESLADGELSALFAEAEATMDNTDPDSSFVDYQGDEPKFRRYWQEVSADGTVNEPKQRVLICARCGEDGHFARDCFAKICGKCGIRNEHYTLGCPMSKKCFTCGMTGHINRDCTYVGRMQALGCDRCGNPRHVTLECPSLWRIYTYVPPETRNTVLEKRTAARNLNLGEGGEGYIATDEWCYNCGHSGHLGDDCRGRSALDRSDDPSAFGTYNVQTGPFSDLTVPSDVSRKPSRHQRESNLEADVGRKAKEKRMRENRERERERNQRDDRDDDWFRKRRRSRSRSPPRRNERDRRDERDRDRNRNDRDRDSRRSRDKDKGGSSDSTKHSLLSRISSPRSSTKGTSSPHSSSFKPIKLKSDAGQRPWDTGKPRSSGHGPRYRGGYDR